MSIKCSEVKSTILDGMEIVNYKYVKSSLKYSIWVKHILLVEVVLQLCDCLSGGLGLLQKQSQILRTELDICCLLQEEICSHTKLLDLCEELLQTRQMPMSCMSKYRELYTTCMNTQTHMCILQIQTLLCSSSVFRLSRLLKISSLCSSLFVLLINLQTVSLSASKFCQELRVSLRGWRKQQNNISG